MSTQHINLRKINRKKHIKVEVNNDKRQVLIKILKIEKFFEKKRSNKLLANKIFWQIKSKNNRNKKEKYHR